MDFERCERDAREIDATRARLRTCQRARDGDGGASAELRAQLAALQAMHTAEVVRHSAEVTALRQRPRWRTVAIAAGVGVLVGGVMWEVVR